MGSELLSNTVVLAGNIIVGNGNEQCDAPACGALNLYFVLYFGPIGPKQYLQLDRIGLVLHSKKKKRKGAINHIIQQIKFVHTVQFLRRLVGALVVRMRPPLDTMVDMKNGFYGMRNPITPKGYSCSSRSLSTTQ